MAEFWKDRERRNRILFWFILVTAVFLRVAGLGIFPDGKGLNQDEAFAGYEAYSLLHYGIDSHGYSFPVYLVAWGSGMNALETYCMIPFIAIFGLTPLAIRLPQAILGCVTVYVFYKLLKKEHSEEIALAGMAFLAITPWHLMLSRWGLESNFLPGFLLLGLYFTVAGMEESKYFLPAGIFYGLSLYAYATVWPVMPVIVGGTAAAVLIYKRGKVDKWFWIGLVILAIVALPLVLFVFVNYGLMPEFKLGFLSIPKLAARRSVELSFHPSEWIRNFRNALLIFITKDDGNLGNASGGFGLYYIGGLVFALFGLIVMIVQFIKDRKKHFLHICIMIQGVASLILMCLIYVNFNRANVIHIPLIYCIVMGISTLACGMWKKKTLKIVFCSLFSVFYLVQFVLFIRFYTGYFNTLWKIVYHPGLREVTAYAEENRAPEGTCFVSDILYPRILEAAQYPADRFCETVVYLDDEAEYLEPISFEGYRFGMPTEDEMKAGDVLILGYWETENIEYMDSLGYSKEEFEYYTVYVH